MEGGERSFNPTTKENLFKRFLHAVTSGFRPSDSSVQVGKSRIITPAEAEAALNPENPTVAPVTETVDKTNSTS